MRKVGPTGFFFRKTTRFRRTIDWCFRENQQEAARIWPSTIGISCRRSLKPIQWVQHVFNICRTVIYVHLATHLIYWYSWISLWIPPIRSCVVRLCEVSIGCWQSERWWWWVSVWAIWKGGWTSIPVVWVYWPHTRIHQKSIFWDSQDPKPKLWWTIPTFLSMIFPLKPS